MIRYVVEQSGCCKILLGEPAPIVKVDLPVIKIRPAPCHRVLMEV